MNNFTQSSVFSPKRWILILSILIAGLNIQAQTVMYGDTVFWENFGNGTVRSDITGLGKIGGLYKYEGPINYVYSLNPQYLIDYMNANLSKDYITDVPTFQYCPINTTSPQYAIKPTDTVPQWTDKFFRITSWRNRTFSSLNFGDTQTLPAWDDAGSVENQIPAAWIRRNGAWNFGVYYITYSNPARTAVPDDGHYALIDNLNKFGVAWLPPSFKDHTGYLNDSTSPLDPTDPSFLRVPAGEDTGRMLFVNCAAVAGVTGPVYKRLVTELCRDAWFEFSAWMASTHITINNSQFRLEFWSADPGNDPGLGTLDASYEGMVIPEANNAKLLKVGTIYAGIHQKWQQITEQFKLEDQDYVWVVMRNYGAGGTGNDIVIDDLVFKPWAPFTLTVTLSPASIATACQNGLITMLSYFPPAASIPAYIDIREYSYYFEGESEGIWYRVGNAVPLRTQDPAIPLELTIPISEYNLYDRFRVAVASTPSGFGGKCVTFTKPPEVKVPIPGVPQFRISGADVCDNSTPTVPSTQDGTFVIKNLNQAACEGWHIKVKMPDGSIQTFTPPTKAVCP